MRKTTFTSASANEKAFNSLPFLPPAKAKLESVKILRQLVKSSVALAELKGTAKILPNPQILLNAVILKEARASSEIENVITTQDKLYQALSSKGVMPDSATKEVLRYREAMLHGFRFIKKKGFLSTNAIIEIQKILEENNAGIRKLPGTALRNAATGKVIYVPPDNADVLNRLMRNLEEYLNTENDISPLIKMAVQHYQFESIHPFYDGNGRTGRILNVLYLILHKQLETPVLYLSDYIINHKADYYRLLQEVRVKNNWEAWIIYILKGIEHTANETIAQVNSIDKVFSKTLELVKNKLPNSYSKELVELLFEQPYCKAEYLIQRLGISRITASKYLKELEKIKILKSRQVWKETLYINVILFDLLKK
ncbi:MAG: addiction module protein [Bacteroidetes bacterium]|nr:addiction module protein [Bacteroidota bacterium]